MCHFVSLAFMGCLRLVSSLKLKVSFAEYLHLYRALLQKRPISLKSLLIVVTPYLYAWHFTIRWYFQKTIQKFKQSFYLYLCARADKYVCVWVCLLCLVVLVSVSMCQHVLCFQICSVCLCCQIFMRDIPDKYLCVTFVQDHSKLETSAWCWNGEGPRQRTGYCCSWQNDRWW